MARAEIEITDERGLYAGMYIYGHAKRRQTIEDDYPPVWGNAKWVVIRIRQDHRIHAAPPNNWLVEVGHSTYMPVPRGMELEVWDYFRSAQVVWDKVLAARMEMFRAIDYAREVADAWKLDVSPPVKWHKPGPISGWTHPSDPNGLTTGVFVHPTDDAPTDVIAHPDPEAL